MTKLILALDTDSHSEMGALMQDLRHLIDWVKVGHQAVCVHGLGAIVEMCATFDYKVFVDFKFHDIPSTVRRNVEMLAGYGVDMLNVHTMGGVSMMHEAECAAKATSDPPLVLGVTVLTSHVISQSSVVQLAMNAQEAGLDGVVCSPLEVEAIRRMCGKDFTIVTPGIRPLWAKSDDHVRYATPIEMTRLCTDYIVVGRPILESKDPIQATKRILEELNGKLPEDA